MKIRTASVNEGMSAGYVSSQFDDAAGFSYTILPLSTNLSQKGNSKPNDKGVFKHYVGDHVTGECAEDGKKYCGNIVRIEYNQETGKAQFAYILDDATSNILPLIAKTVKSVKVKIGDQKQMDYFKRNQNRTHQISVSESFDFNSTEL